MTGVIPAKLDLHEDRVKNILDDTGYLAYRMHVSLQNPHWLHVDTDVFEHIETFIHFKAKELPIDASDESLHPYVPQPFDSPNRGDSTVSFDQLQRFNEPQGVEMSDVLSPDSPRRALSTVQEEQSVSVPTLRVAQDSEASLPGIGDDAETPKEWSEVLNDLNL